MKHTAEDVASIFEHWNSKKIVVHKVLTKDKVSAIVDAFDEGYTPEVVKEVIDLYATVLENEFTWDQKQEGAGKYYWSYKWNLVDFLKRGLRSFEGKTPDDFLRRKVFTSSEGITFKRK